MYMYINILDMYMYINIKMGGINNKHIFHIELDL